MAGRASSSSRRGSDSRRSGDRTPFFLRTRSNTLNSDQSLTPSARAAASLRGHSNELRRFETATSDSDNAFAVVSPSASFASPEATYAATPHSNPSRKQSFVERFRASSFGSFVLNAASARLQEYATNEKPEQERRNEQKRTRPFSEKSKNKFARKLGKPDREKANILDKTKPTKKLEEWHNLVERSAEDTSSPYATIRGLPIIPLVPLVDNLSRRPSFSSPPSGVDSPPRVYHHPEPRYIAEPRYIHEPRHLQEPRYIPELRYIPESQQISASDLVPERDRFLAPFHQASARQDELRLRNRLSHISEVSQEASGTSSFIAEMDASRLAPAARSLADQQDKARRVKDAQDVFEIIQRNAERAGTRVPPYDFIELIGKGAFGRVYKCREQKTGNLVAVKIVNIDEQDWSEGFAMGDSRDMNLNDFKKEVSILRQLKDNNAKNVNVIHDAFDFHSQLWIVADYCTGGSIRTLLRPFEVNGRPQGLPEQYIIPIARELAVAIKSVHDLHIIHRDIKCANVYITEDGDIQLGDFGIVGVIDHDNSKRKTVIGTPHWMPREIVESLGDKYTTEGYGSEVDIWSYGCTVYEMATGSPPYSRVAIEMLPSRLEEDPPRLEGDQYSEELKDLIAFCLNPDKQARPSAADILEHPYIKDTSLRHPTRALVRLIEKFKIWEHGGGSRASLWMAGPYDVRNDRREDENKEDSEEDFEGWNFSTSDSFDKEFGRRLSQLPPGTLEDWQWDVPHGAGLSQLQPQNISVAERIKREHSELSANRGEQFLARLYDPNDPSGYQLKTPMDTPASGQSTPPSDLPLREFTSNAPTRESMIEIDLDEAGVSETATSTFAMHMNQMNAINEDTVRPIGRHSSNYDDDDDNFQYGQFDDKRATMEWSFANAAPAVKRDTMQWSFATAGPIEPTETALPEKSKPKRGTMDWTFGNAEPASPDEEYMPANATSAGFPDELGPAFRPQLKHTITEPIGHFRDFSHSSDTGANALNRGSVSSFIDLDAGVAERVLAGNEISRPATASSQMTDATSGNPFDLEDDPEQRQLDRNRFSYHKAYRSEGNDMVKRLSHKTMQMHARGNSLSSTESEMAASQTMSHGASTLAPPMGFDALDHDLGISHPLDNESNQWPSFGNTFDGFDSSPQYVPGPPDDMRLPRLADFAPRAAGLSISSRTYESSEPPGPTVDFPHINFPHPDALMEHTDDQMLEGELGRFLDDAAFSLTSMVNALRQHAGIEEDEEFGGDGETTDGEAVELTARRKPRKSPRLPVAENYSH